jgi:hypothetical protein
MTNDRVLPILAGWQLDQVLAENGERQPGP